MADEPLHYIKLNDRQCRQLIDLIYEAVEGGAEYLEEMEGVGAISPIIEEALKD